MNIITLMHILHRSNGLVNPCEVFVLELVFLSWVVQTSVHVLEVDKMPMTVH